MSVTRSGVRDGKDMESEPVRFEVKATFIVFFICGIGSYAYIPVFLHFFRERMDFLAIIIPFLIADGSFCLSIAFTQRYPVILHDREIELTRYILLPKRYRYPYSKITSIKYCRERHQKAPANSPPPSPHFHVTVDGRDHNLSVRLPEEKLREELKKKMGESWEAVYSEG